MRGYIFVTILFLFLAGCSDELPRIADTYTAPRPIEVNDPALTLRAGTNKNKYLIFETILVTIRNGSDSIIYFNQCNQTITFHLQKFFDGRWQDITSRGIPCTGFNFFGTFTLYPGRVYNYSDGMVAEGTYRFRFPMLIGENSVTNWLYTNSFDVVRYR